MAGSQPSLPPNEVGQMPNSWEVDVAVTGSGKWRTAGEITPLRCSLCRHFNWQRHFREQAPAKVSVL